MRKLTSLANIVITLATMFLVWDFEPGVKETVEVAANPAGPWFFYGPAPTPVDGLCKVHIAAGYEKLFFRVKREIVFDIAPKSK